MTRLLWIERITPNRIYPSPENHSLVFIRSRKMFFTHHGCIFPLGWHYFVFLILPDLVGDDLDLLEDPVESSLHLHLVTAGWSSVSGYWHQSWHAARITLHWTPHSQLSWQGEVSIGEVTSYKTLSNSTNLMIETYELLLVMFLTHQVWSECVLRLVYLQLSHEGWEAGSSLASLRLILHPQYPGQPVEEDHLDPLWSQPEVESF